MEPREQYTDLEVTVPNLGSLVSHDGRFHHLQLPNQYSGETAFEQAMAQGQAAQEVARKIQNERLQDAPRDEADASQPIVDSQ